eukprot:1066870-Prorocentrum_minimum.AAC.2
MRAEAPPNFAVVSLFKDFDTRMRDATAEKAIAKSIRFSSDLQARVVQILERLFARWGTPRRQDKNLRKHLYCFTRHYAIPVSMPFSFASPVSGDGTSSSLCFEGVASLAFLPDGSLTGHFVDTEDKRGRSLGLLGKGKRASLNSQRCITVVKSKMGTIDTQP